MTYGFGVVDLFAGAGGLGEGFAAAGLEDGGRMTIRLSVECDLPAVSTLRLRAFLRSFDHGFPRAYYDSLNSGGTLPDWSAAYSVNWCRAVDEVHDLRLGSEGAFDVLAPRLDAVREEYHGSTILIGGPPCQAYSVVGRARNRGKRGYVPENDYRHFLYREYVAILSRLRPAAFVMENVKGLLSSMVDGGQIIEQVMEDLEQAGDGYRLVPLTGGTSDFWRPRAKDFLVEAEQHGVPQTRHRIFVVGIRKDIAVGLQDRSFMLSKSAVKIPVTSIIQDLAPLRSGLSMDDSPDEWRFQLRRSVNRLVLDPATPSDVAVLLDQLLENGLGDLSARVASRTAPTSHRLPPELAARLHDPHLKVVTHHETRSHMAADLGRYVYAAASSRVRGRSPRLNDMPASLQPAHANRDTEIFKDRFRVQLGDGPSGTITSHIAKDGHYFIHPDPMQCRSFTVREAARIQTFPDNYTFCGNRTQQYHQIGNAVPPFLALQIARCLRDQLAMAGRVEEPSWRQPSRAVGFA